MERICLLSLVRETQAADRYKTYFSTHGKILQSSVALLLRIAPSYSKCAELCAKLTSMTIEFNYSDPQQNILPSQQLDEALLDHEDLRLQCVFVQRAFHLNELSSGQIAFPGGTARGGENDFEAVIRQSNQEIGLHFGARNTLYLGKLPKNFYVHQTSKDVAVYITLHIFLWVSYESIPFHLNFKQMRDARWIDMSTFFSISKENIKILKNSRSFNSNKVPAVLRRSAENSKNYFKYREFCGIDIGMENDLCGVTFFFIVYILSLIRATFIGDSHEADIQKINFLIEKSAHYKLVFDNTYYLGGLLNYVMKRVHRESRIEQFIYRTPQELSVMSKRRLACLSVATVLPVTAIAFPLYRSSL